MSIGTRILILLALVAALLGGYEWWAHHQRELGRVQAQAEQLQRDLAAERAARAQEQQINHAQKEAIDDYIRQAHQARVDAADTVAAGQRLRDGLRLQLAAATARSAARCNAPADASGPPATAPADLLADVQRRLDEAADGIAQHADAARAAGRLCERAYDALTPAALGAKP